MRDLKGKKALVTGAASGLGRAIAVRLAQEGVDLFLVDIDEPGLEETAALIHPHGVAVEQARCDLGSRDEINRLVARLGQVWGEGELDVLVNNAGVAYYGPTHLMTPDQWEWLLDINLRGPIRLTTALLPGLLDRPEAHVLNMCSISGLVAGGRFSAYHVSKFGLIGYSEALRAEYGRNGLGVTALCPGPVRTQLYRNAPCGHQHKTTPEPPAWICASPEQVANKAVRAIQRDWGLVLVSPLAYLLYYAKRLCPGLLDHLQRFGRRRKMRKKAAEWAARQQAAATTQQSNNRAA